MLGQKYLIWAELKNNPMFATGKFGSPPSARLVSCTLQHFNTPHRKLASAYFQGEEYSSFCLIRNAKKRKKQKKTRKWANIPNAKKREKAQKQNQIFLHQKKAQTRENPRMFFCEFLFNGQVMNRFEESQPYFSSKYLYYFFSGNFAFCLQFDAGKEGNLREMIQAMIPVHCLYHDIGGYASTGDFF